MSIACIFVRRIQVEICRPICLKLISYTLRNEHRVVKDCYSRLSFISGVTHQIWWRHNAKSEKTILGDNGEMSARWVFIVELCVDDN